MGRMLVSKYVSEDRDKNRRVARACNIATYIKENFAKLEGSSIAPKAIRKSIRFKIDPTSRYVADNRTKKEIEGDNRAHGDAWGKSGLKLSTVGTNGSKKIEFSLPNLKRSVSYLLGQGPKVGALELKTDKVDSNCLEETNDLIDRAMKIPTEKLKEWERIFVLSLNKKWRKKGLSDKQKARLKLVLLDRS